MLALVVNTKQVAVYISAQARGLETEETFATDQVHNNFSTHETTPWYPHLH